MAVVNEERLVQIEAVKSRYEAELMRKANVVGVGVGLRQVSGLTTDEPAVVVSVTRKAPMSQLAPHDVIPRELDGVPVDVQVVGELRAF